MKWIRLSNTLNRFKAAIKAFRLSDDSSKSNSKQSNMSNRIQILNDVKTVYPHTLLPCLLETCIVTFDFCSQCVNFLKRNTVTVNGKFVIIGKSNIFGASSIFLAIIPAFVIAWTTFVFRLFQWAAVFLPVSVIVIRFTIFRHSKTCFTNGMSAWELFGFLVFRLLRGITHSPW